MTVAPLPSGDSYESPLMFVATTLTIISSANCNEKGEPVKDASGILQLASEIVCAVLPSQSARFVLKVRSAFLKLIV